VESWAAIFPSRSAAAKTAVSPVIAADRRVDMIESLKQADKVDTEMATQNSKFLINGI
jgi:hypothetical protein